MATMDLFSPETSGDRRFVVTTGMSVAAIVLATAFGLFPRIPHTTSLSLAQWAVCLVAGVVVVIPTELRKVVLRRRATSEGRTS